MYYYIYDAFSNQRRFKKIRDRIETRCTDLGVRGKIGRLNLLTNIRELIRTGKRNGAKTIVVVGEDVTFFGALLELVRSNLIVGFIPLQSSSILGRVLGIPTGELACDILAQRRIKRLDLGKINETPFLHSLVVHNAQPTVLVENEYTITPLQASDLIILNLPGILVSGRLVPTDQVSPTDATLNIVIERKKHFWQLQGHEEQESHFPVKKITVASDRAITFDRDMMPTTFEPPISIQIAKQRLSCIVGKERLFS